MGNSSSYSIKFPLYFYFFVGSRLTVVMFNCMLEELILFTSFDFIDLFIVNSLRFVVAILYWVTEGGAILSLALVG